MAKLRMIRPSPRSLPVAGRTLLAAGLTLLAVSAPAQVITTLVGAGPDTGPALVRSIGWPYQVTLDSSGNRYIATGPMHVVVKVDPTGVLSVVAGTGADDFSGDGGLSVNASLRNPTGVAVDPSGNVYISDSFMHVIRKVTAATGIITTIAGSPGISGNTGDGGPAASALVNAPNHLAHLGGFLYIADTNSHRIRRIDLTALPNPTIGLVAGSTQGLANGAATTAQFNFPNGVAVDASGNVYVADTNNNLVRRVSGGLVSTVAGTGAAGFGPDGVSATSSMLNRPEGVAVDASGNVLLIADQANNRIRRVATGIITTVAGNGSFGFSGDTGPATAAALNRPYSMVIDGGNNIHIADTFNSRLRVVSAGNINTVAGNGSIRYSGDGGSAMNAVLYEQRHIALDPSGAKLFIGDEINARVRKVDVSAGTIFNVAGTGLLVPFNDNLPATSVNLRQPYGMAVDSLGNIYIADTFNHLIRKVDPGGFLTTVAGTGTAGFNGDGSPATGIQLNTPSGVALDSSGNLYIVDTGNHRIRKLTGTTMTTFAGMAGGGYDGEGPATAHKLSSPQGVAVDAAGNVYVADYGNYRIRKIDLGGNMSTVAGNGPPGGFAGDGLAATAAKLNFPRGVAVDAAGNILIADTNNHRVRMVEARTGRITTVAGNGTAGFAGDGGPAIAAKLNQPYSVAVNSQGRVFISDQLNSRIRVMTLGTDLSITKDDFQTSATPGTPVSYTVRVTNNGPNTVTSVNVVDTVPPALLGVAYAPASGIYTPGTGDWTGLSLGTGQSVDMIVSGNIASSATGSLTNTVKVSPPLGLTDPTPGNDQAQDTDVLTPQADVSIGISDAPDPVSVGVPLSYTLSIFNNGPSNATSVVVTDALPPGVTFQSASPPCVFNTLVTCALGSLPAGSGFPLLTIVVMPTQPGTITNTATVTHGEGDANALNDSATATTLVDAGAADTVRYLTVTSKSTLNVLQWLNPVGFGNVRIRYKSSPTACSFPVATDGSDGSLPVVDFLPGTPNQPGRFDHGPIANGDHYCYTAWVDKSGSYSAGKVVEGRPFPVPAGPGVKWSYNMGIFSMAPPGNGVGVVYAVAQDGSLHSMVKGAAPEGGTWPAPVSGFPLTWLPQSMNGPSQGRPSGIPVATAGSTRTIFLSSQDGHVYAFNAETGAPAWSPSSPPLAPSPNLQAHPSGVFTVFGGTRDLIFVGTRDPAGSRFYALRVLDGDELAPGWEFDGTPFGKIGAISGQAAVDQVAGRVYFASREFDAINNNTVWCLDLETGVPCTGFTPLPHGNIDTGVSLYGTRLLVGTNNAGGTDPRVRALRTGDGGEDWSFPILPATEGAPKGYVAIDRFTGDSYFSTATTVWAVDSAGSEKWHCPSLTSPSIPVYAPGDAYVYVGAGDGKLYRLDVAGGIPIVDATFPLLLGDGSSGVGSPTFDLAAGYMYVGTEDGFVYAVQLP